MADPVTRAGWPVRVGMRLRRKKDDAWFIVSRIDHERGDVALRPYGWAGRAGVIFVYNLSDRYEPAEPEVLK